MPSFGSFLSLIIIESNLSLNNAAPTMHPAFLTEYFHKLPECIFFYWKIHAFSAILTYQTGKTLFCMERYGVVQL